MEVNKMTWQVEEEHTIYDAVKDWGSYRFVCLMKDNTIQIFSGFMDETCDGEINVHIHCVSDDNHDNVDDILMWIEVPEKQSKETANGKNMPDTELLALCKSWFEEIADRCNGLTSGNISHRVKFLKGLAKNAAELVNEQLK